MKYVKVLVLIFVLSLLSNCKDKPLQQDEMKDVAGNRYKTVTIGKQVWMAENLKALYTNTANDRNYNPKPANFYYPDDDYRNHSTYGLLYPFEGAKELLPKGWRIPTLRDVDELLAVIGVNYESGGGTVCSALKIDVYPGTNESDIFSIDKYFSLMLDEPATSVVYDYRTLFFYAIDYPDDELFKRTIYSYNVTRNFASSVRFVKNID